MASVHQKQPAPSVITSAPSGTLGTVKKVTLSFAFVPGESPAEQPAANKVNNISAVQKCFICQLPSYCRVSNPIPYNFLEVKYRKMSCCVALAHRDEMIFHGDAVQLRRPAVA